MNECEHKTKHTEKTPYHPATVYGQHFFGRYSQFEVPEVKSYIITHCADCGVKLKQIEVKS